MLPPNTILQNRYRVLGKLGQGGMGTVYEALDQRVNCIVALKETTAGANEETRRAFEREAALLGNLRHSALPKVMDYFSEGEGDFLVMEFIPGYDLAELLELRVSPFPQAQVMRWADELLRVLEYLHSRQPPILHRDIKPSNLKLTKQGEIFLLDFGLAKGSTGQMPTLMTDRSVRGYTKVYASLEQIHGHGTDPRSDLYSLGATLYHLLAGIVPIDAPTRFNVVEDDQPDPLQPIEKLNQQVSPNVAAVIQKAMSINRRRRPANAVEMRKALRKAVEEDEQHAAEEEYRRAEEKRRQRETVHRKPEIEAVRRAEEERQQQQEAETRKLAEERQGREKQRRREEESARRAEVEQQRRPNLAVTTPASTVRAEQSASEEPQPGITTLKAAPPHRPFGMRQRRVADAGGIFATDEYSLSRHPKTRAVIVVVAGLIGVVALVVTALLIRAIRTQKQAVVESAQPAQVSQQVKQTDNSQATYVNKYGMEFVLIPPGSFMMGSNTEIPDEKPVHRVVISQPFYIGKYEVTQAAWQAVMGSNPSHFKGYNLPVEQVSWLDAQQFVKKLNQLSDGYIYRLPTESEWEYACRAGTTENYPGDPDSMAWYFNNSGNKTHPVGQKAPNGFRLYDMLGNVWEWCEDSYNGDYTEAPTNGSARLGGLEQKTKMRRGGSWSDSASSAIRYWGRRDDRSDNIGFRVVAVVRTP